VTSAAFKGATTLSIMTFGILTLKNDIQRNDTEHNRLNSDTRYHVMLSVAKLNVTLLIGIMPNVVAPMEECDFISKSFYKAYFLNYLT
jgi:hypothetical protein